MAEDWSIDVRKYVPDADGDIIAGIVRYCGIALRNRDSSLVSFSDKTETDRVKANFLQKKLGLTDADEVLDAAIAKVGERMKEDRTKNRVTVYYLLAEAFGRLEDFRPKAKGKAKAAAEDAVLPLAAAPEPVPVIEPVMAPPPPPPPPPPPAPPAPMAAPAAPVAAPQPLMAAAAPVARPAPVRRARSGLLWPLTAALIAFGGVAGLIIFGSSKPGSAPPAPIAAPAAVAPPVAVPDGAGVTEQTVAGRPQVSIYFDTGKADLDASFGEHTQALRDWLDANPGHHLVISGYNDPRGNAELNAALSKARAFAVRDALVGQGVGTDEIDLVKPADTNQSDASLAEARRVDVSIADGPVPEGEAATKPSPRMP